MKILIGNWSITGIGGSEQHARALAAEFMRQGHDVDTVQLGERMPAHDGPAFLSHKSVVTAFLEANPNGRCVQTIHGLSPAEEEPVRDPRVTHVGVSYEVAKAHGLRNVITQGVDLDLFAPMPDTPPRRRPDSMLSLAQSEDFNDMLRGLARKHGLAFNACNKFTNPTPNIERHMRAHGIVVGIGRSAVEAAACGCMVIIADHRPYQPAWSDGIFGEAYREVAPYNFSGRRFKMPATHEYIDSLLMRWHDGYGQLARAFAARYHDIRDKAAQYLQVWEQGA